MRFSLRKKTIVLVISITVIIGLVAVVIFNDTINDIIQTQYKERSIDIANLVSLEVDPVRVKNIQRTIRDIYYKSENKVWCDQWGTPEFDEYVAQYSFIEETEDFKVVRDELRKMQDVLDVNCLYLLWMDVDNQCLIYLVDADYEEPCPPGCIDPIYLQDLDVLKDPSIGLAPNISNTQEYGWLIATGMPVFDENGEVLAYATVDISMNEIVARQTRFLTYTIIIFLILTIIICFAGIFVVSRVILRPINRLSHAAEQYTSTRKSFSELKINRSDEIGILADSMANMEAEIGNYIENLEKTTNDLISARENAENLNRIANIDALTRVRNKRAFDIDAAKLNETKEPYGIVMIDQNGLKWINDTFGHVKGDISIKTVCKVVCEVFKHSPVYRVGGDEFIVILKNDDFNDRESLIQKLTDTFINLFHNKELSPWERVTAAVGYSVFDSKRDKGVDDVLKRADAAMYRQKRTLKEELGL